MIYLDLFLTFLQIGTFSFGGGYGMISLIRERVLANGWMTEEAIMNFIAVSESTPGPIAVNMATFVGSSQAGILGALAATFGLVLPSFVIILIIAAAMRALMKHKVIQGILSGIKPVVIGLILATAFTMFLSVCLSVSTFYSGISVNYSAFIILGILILTSVIYKRFAKKAISPLYLILISAICGMILY